MRSLILHIEFIIQTQGFIPDTSTSYPPPYGWKTMELRGAKELEQTNEIIIRNAIFITKFSWLTIVFMAAEWSRNPVVPGSRPTLTTT